MAKYPSQYTGQNFDTSVQRALNQFPGQISTLNTKVAALEEDVDDLSGLPAQVTQIGLKLNDLNLKVDGLPEVEIALSEYELVNGGDSNNTWYNTSNYGTYHRCKFIPIGNYHGRKIQIVKGQDPTRFAVIKRIPATGEAFDFATGFSSTVSLSTATSPYTLEVPDDAEYVYIYITDTRTTLNGEPQSMTVLEVLSVAYSREETDQIVSALDSEMKDVDSRTYAENVPGNTPTKYSDGCLVGSQTVGQQVSINSTASGKVQTLSVPSGAKAKIFIKDHNGSYGFAICDSNGIVIESTANNIIEGDSFVFSPRSFDTVLYVSTWKLAGITFILPIEQKLLSVTMPIEEDVEDLKSKMDALVPIVADSEEGYVPVELTLQNGYFYANNGDFVSTNDQRCAEIQVKEGEQYKITSHLRVSVIALIVEWNAYGSYVGYVKKGSGTDENVVDYEYTVPSGVTKIGITNADAHYYLGPSAKKNGIVLTPKAYTKEEIGEGLPFQENVELAGGTIGNGFVNSLQTIGGNISFGSFSEHIVFEIPANIAVHISATSGGNYGFALTDAEDKVLEYFNTYTTLDYTFSARNQATRLYVSAEKYANGYMIENENLVERVQSIGEDVEDIKEEIAGIRTENRWKGKTIWWCGTSIPAGSDATIPGADETIAGNYPTEVGNDLQATVINKAVGGSMCRANVRTGDYVGANYANITSCLTMTKEEIENFISNYSTIKDVLTGGAPQTLDSSYLARLRAASFEDRLLPYLNGTYTMPDLFVIDHGHNDFKYRLSNNTTDIGLEPTVANIGGELAEDTYMTANNNAKLESFLGSLANIPSTKKAAFIASLNRNCYIGAVNFIVTLILKYNPHARILFISNYEYENGDQKTYAPLIPVQENLAKSWAFPLCEVYKYVGYSDHIIPGSMAWFNTTYPAQTPATTDITVYKAYLPDGVHPHSDITGDANNIYAGIISEFIKKIY